MGGKEPGAGGRPVNCWHGSSHAPLASGARSNSAGHGRGQGGGGDGTRGGGPGGEEEGGEGRGGDAAASGAAGGGGAADEGGREGGGRRRGGAGGGRKQEEELNRATASHPLSLQQERPHRNQGATYQVHDGVDLSPWYPKSSPRLQRDPVGASS